MIQCDKPQRQTRLVRILDQGFAPLGLFDFTGPLQQGFEIAILVDQFSGGFDPDAAHAGHIVDGIAGQGLNLHHLAGRNAEFLHHLGRADAAVADGIEHFDHAIVHELHQILVGRNNGDACAQFARKTGVSGDQIVSLKTLFFHAGDAESASGIAHQRELRDQIFRRFGAVGFVFGIKRVAEGDLARVEDNRDMTGLFTVLAVFQQFPQHVAITGDRAGRQTVGFAAERGQRVIGAKEITRAIDQIEMIALLQCAGLLAGHEWWFAPSRNLKRRSQ